MINTAAGYIASVGENVSVPGQGLAPKFWWGSNELDIQEAPWASAPLGSIYVYKPDEETTPRVYQKVANEGETTDWPQLITQANQAARSFRVQQIPLSEFALNTTNEIDTGWELPTYAVVVDVFVEITAAEETATTKTIDVGLLSSAGGGDADGFVDGLPTADDKILHGTLSSSGQTLGAYLRVDESGDGVLVPHTHVAASIEAKGVSFTLGEAATELDGYIYIVYYLLNEF